MTAMTPRRRAILRQTPKTPDPLLPAGFTIIDRRTINVPSRSGAPGGPLVELLVAGDALTEVPEACEWPTLTLEEFRLAAATWAAILAPE